MRKYDSGPKASIGSTGQVVDFQRFFEHPCSVYISSQAREMFARPRNRSFVLGGLILTLNKDSPTEPYGFGAFATCRAPLLEEPNPAERTTIPADAERLTTGERPQCDALSSLA